MSDVVIVGAAESARLGVVPDQSAMSLATECALAALAQAGLTIADVDGVAGTMSPIEIAFALGAKPRWLDGTMVGGCSYMLHVRHAVAAIRDGPGRGRGDRARRIRPLARRRAGLRARTRAASTGQFELPYGVLGAFTRFTLPVMAYLDKYGLGESDLAEVPVAQSRWSSRNPRAFRPQAADRRRCARVADDRLAVPPARMLPGQRRRRRAGADLGASAPPTWTCAIARSTVIGSGESCEGPGPVFMEDLTSFRAFRDASAEAMRTAGIVHADVDHLMIYDAFAHLPIYGLEDMGFVGRGEAVDFIRGGATSPGGTLPTNTNGGGILYAHTGMYGMFALLEAVRQLQGRAAAQLADPRVSLVLGAGGMFSAAGAVALRAN